MTHPDEPGMLHRDAAGYKASEDDTRLLCEAVENYIEAEGTWQLITLPGVYDALKAAFGDDIEQYRTEYQADEAEALADDED